MRRQITLRCLWGLLSLSACGGSSSRAPDSGAPTDGDESAGQGGSSGAAGAAAGKSGVGLAGGAFSGGAGRGGVGSGGSGGSGSLGRGGAGSAGSAGAAGKPTLGCAHWQLDLTPGNPSNAMLVDGGVKLTRPIGTIRSTTGYFNSAEVALEQTGLVGDFDVTIGFKDFVPGNAVPFTGPRLTAGVWWHDKGASGRIYQGSGRVGETTGAAVLIHGQQFDNIWLDPTPTPSSLVGASGAVHVQRVGSVVAVEVSVNGQVTTAKSSSTEPFTEEPLTLFIGFDHYSAPFGEPSTVESGVTITSVEVTGGGGLVLSDDFSCR